jgi:hypothetical protein
MKQQRQHASSARFGLRAVFAVMIFLGLGLAGVCNNTLSAFLVLMGLICLLACRERGFLLGILGSLGFFAAAAVIAHYVH